MDKVFRIPIRQEAPVSDPKHLVTKEYVEAVLEGMLWDPVDAATTAPLPACVVDGAFKKLTASANGAFPAVDTVSLTVGGRLLVKDEVNSANNGVYRVADVGDSSTPWVLMRADDADEVGEFVVDKTVHVLAGGAVNGNKTFKFATLEPITLGSTDILFAPYVDLEPRIELVDLDGDNSTTEFVIAHGRSTLYPIVKIRNDTTLEYEEFGITVVDSSHVKVTCDPALTTGDHFTVIICGQNDPV